MCICSICMYICIYVYIYTLYLAPYIYIYIYIYSVVGINKNYIFHHFTYNFMYVYDQR